MPKTKRSKKEMKQRRISDRSFKIYSSDMRLLAEMSNGRWIKKPKK